MEKKFSLTNDAGKMGYPYEKELNWTHVTPHTKIDSKWITGLNIRREIMKLLEENIKKIFIIFLLAIISWICPLKEN